MEQTAIDDSVMLSAEYSMENRPACGRFFGSRSERSTRGDFAGALAVSA